MPGQRTSEHRSGGSGLGLARKVGLGLLVLLDLLVVSVGLRRRRLPDLVRALRGRALLRIRALEPRRLGKIVYRVLSPGTYEPRCLVSSLVFLRMLRRQGTAAEVVIGLPPEPATHETHAWVEVDGREVGPPPGRLGHREMARFGASRGTAPS